MKTGDSVTRLQELKDQVAKFRDDRNWGKHHSPKNLSISIAVEAAELLELFQWDDYTKKDQKNIAAELSDVLIYCFMMADSLDIDISSEFKDKLAKAAKKYPVSTFNEFSDSPDDYNNIKRAYRQNKK